MNGVPTATLGDIAQPKQWPTLSMAEMSTTGFPVYGANGRIGYTDRFTHERPTILIGCRGSCGTVHITAPRSYANGNAMALDALDESRVDIHFLARFLVHRGFLDVTTGSSQPQIIRQNLIRVQVPLPSLPEQRRIAGVLDKVDALRENRRHALAQLDALGRSIFLDMFGDPAANPKGWPRYTLRELGKVKTGGTPPSAKAGMFDGPVPFVTPGDLESDAPVKRSVTEAGANESETVRPGATLVCCIGATIGKIGRAEARSAFNQQINAVEWGDSVHDTYGYAVLHFFKPTIIAWGASTTLPILKKSAFERIEIPVPALELQAEFASRSAELDQLKRSFRAALAYCDDLFASLQARVFQGEQ